jgi:hypothetical protein
MLECTESPDSSEPLALPAVTTLIQEKLRELARKLEHPAMHTQATLLDKVTLGQTVRRFDERGHLIVPVPEKKKVKKRGLAGSPDRTKVKGANEHDQDGKKLEETIEKRYRDMFWSDETEDTLDTADNMVMQVDESPRSYRSRSLSAMPTQNFAESKLAVAGPSRLTEGRGKGILWKEERALGSVRKRDSSPGGQPFRRTEDDRYGGPSSGRQEQQPNEDDEEKDEEYNKREFKRRKIETDADGNDDLAKRLRGISSSFLAGRSSGEGLWGAAAGA